MSDSSDSFSISDSQIDFANTLALVSTIPGTCVCFLVLVAYAIIAYFPNARKLLDRVTFRLLVYTLIFNVLFGIAYAATPAAPGTSCTVGAFVVNFTLSFSTFFTTCIALNLELVLVHGFNGKRLEKYYVIGTTILSLALNVPTVALDQYGWDEESGTCWYKNSDPKLRLRWIIGTQSFWISLAATIETVCSCVVLFWMYRFQRRAKKLQQAVSPPAKSINDQTQTSPALTSSSRSMTIVLGQDPRYRKIILRIALYPIVSLIVNYSTVALDLNTTIQGMNTQLDYRLLILDLVFYGVRTLAYGILAFGDPSFTNAIRELRGSRRRSVSERLTTLNFASQQAPANSTASQTKSYGDSKIESFKEASNAEQSITDLDIEEVRRFERQL